MIDDERTQIKKMIERCHKFKVSMQTTENDSHNDLNLFYICFLPEIKPF